MNEAINAEQEGNLRPAGSVVVQKMTAEELALEIERELSLARHDEATALYYAQEKGIGIGREAEREEVARKMKEMGEAVEKIHIFTGLPIETIKSISN